MNPEIKKDILYVGVNDHKIDLFEGQYHVPRGMSYNSYVILDEKVCVMDGVDGAFIEEWLGKVHEALGGREADYLFVSHMEPDHSASIAAFSERYPSAGIVSSQKAFDMMRAFFGTDFAERRVVVRDGDVLSLGRHSLRIVAAPMVHWPEVITAFDETDGIYFSADAFGKFGALDVDEPWVDEARRYYIGIVAKYGQQVQALLRKAGALAIKTVCPLHGPVLTGDLAPYLSLYDVWSSYRPEAEGVTVAYASIYGNTRRAAEFAAEQLRQRGMTVVLYDLCRADMAAAVADAFRYRGLVLACSTYNAELFPPMHTFLHALASRGYRGRTVGLIENGSWAPMAASKMRTALEKCADLTFAEPVVSVRSKMTPEDEKRICELADALKCK